MLTRKTVTVVFCDVTRSTEHGETTDPEAVVLERAGRVEEARAALERALSVWERKQCLPCAARVRTQLEAL